MSRNFAELATDLSGYRPIEFEVPSFDGYFVYLLFADRNSPPLYVGMSRQTLRRLGRHLEKRKFSFVLALSCIDEKEARWLESSLIDILDPLLNSDFGKLPPFSDRKRKTTDKRCLNCGKKTRSRYDVCTRASCEAFYHPQRRLKRGKKPQADPRNCSNCGKRTRSRSGICSRESCKKQYWSYRRRSKKS